MAPPLRPAPPSQAWWDAHGEDVCLVAAILCALAGIGLIGLVAFLPL